MKSSMVSRFLITLVFSLLLIIPNTYLASADGEDLAYAAPPSPPCSSKRRGLAMGDPIPSPGIDPPIGEIETTSANLAYSAPPSPPCSSKRRGLATADPIPSPGENPSNGLIGTNSASP
ncbi:hypothetical protein Ccrd_023204 [Cynara cardunculus var. scolymus]|uniref:Uncharacterized protein n=1 Tax=Cynara cardunculus var. scolymus TaxID=59895 RepID=A0A103XXA1_CYNCS|nr:hypothetical protein Ccrd_023204 [Cynara cardunculus var. scolymus]